MMLAPFTESVEVDVESLMAVFDAEDGADILLPTELLSQARIERDSAAKTIVNLNHKKIRLIFTPTRLKSKEHAFHIS